jgi:hypothetical protein
MLVDSRMNRRSGVGPDHVVRRSIVGPQPVGPLVRRGLDQAGPAVQHERWAKVLDQRFWTNFLDQGPGPAQVDQARGRTAALDQLSAAAYLLVINMDHFSSARNLSSSGPLR